MDENLKKRKYGKIKKIVPKVDFMTMMMKVRRLKLKSGKAYTSKL